METSHPDSLDQNSGGTNTEPTPERVETQSADNQVDTSTPSGQNNDQSQAPEGTPGKDDGNTADDEQLLSFAKSVGVSEDKLKDPEIARLVKLARNDRAEKDRNYQAARTAEDKVRSFGDKQFENEKPQQGDDSDENGFYPEGNYPDPDEKVAKRLEKIEWKSTVANFFALNPEAKKYIDDMDKIATERPYMYKDLPLLYEIAQARSGSTDSAREAGRQEERARLAKMSQASAPSASANNPAPSSARTYTRDEIRSMSRSEYMKNREDIRRAETEGRVR